MTNSNATEEVTETTITPKTAAEQPKEQDTETTPEQPESATQSRTEGEQPEQPEKLFTQAQLDEIISRRLAREQKKIADPDGFAADLDKREAALDLRERRLDYHDKITAAALPPEAAELIDFSSEESAQRTFDAVQTLMKQRLDAAVKDEVDRRFKAAGRTPMHSNTSAVTADDRLKAAMHAPNFK